MKKKKLKNINLMYGDFIYSPLAMKKSQNVLMNDANCSLRKAFSDMENLLAKTFLLVSENESSRSELRKIHSLASKLESMIDYFKYDVIRKL